MAEAEFIKDLSDWIKHSGADPEVLEVYELLRQFMESSERKEWLDQREKNWEAVGKNKMWTAAEEKELMETGQLPIVANECNKGVQASAAIATDSKPSVKFYPRKGGSLYLAELAKRAHDLVWEQNRGNTVLFSAVWECKTSGLCAIDSFFDKNKGIFGKVIFEDIKPKGVYFDPNAAKTDWSDSDLIKAYPRTKKYIKGKYGDLVEDSDLSFGGELLGKAATEAEKSTGLTAGDSYTMEDAKTAGSGGKQPKNIWEIEALLLKTENEFICTITFEDGGEPLIFRMRGKDKTKAEEEIRSKYQDRTVKEIDLIPTKVEVRKHRIIVGKKLIEETENPYGEDPDGDPILKLNLLGHWATDSAYPTCPTTFALPLNREKNKRRSQHVYQTSILNNPPLMEPAGKVKWEGRPGTPGAVAKVEAGAQMPPQYLMAQVNTTDFLSHDVQLSKDIQDQYDTPDVVRGRTPVNKKDASGRAIAYLQDLAGVMSKPFIGKLEEFIERIGRANFAIMLRNWKRHQWMALIDETDWVEWMPDEEKAKMQQPQAPGAEGLPGAGEAIAQPGPQAGPMKPNGEMIRKRWMEAIDMLCPLDGEPQLDIMDFEIKVGAGSSMPTNRMAKQAEAMEQVKLGLLDPETYWEQTDSTLKDKVVPRLKAMAQNAAMAEGQKKGKK